MRCRRSSCEFVDAPCVGRTEPLPCGVSGNFTFLRYAVANLPLHNGRTEASAPTERFSVSPMACAILRLHAAGSMWASTPTDALRGCRSLYDFAIARCTEGASTPPRYTKNQQQLKAATHNTSGIALITIATGSKKPRCVCSAVSVLALPIFPVSHPTSIFGENELNFCVRYGNRWTLIPISTNYSIYCALKTGHHETAFLRDTSEPAYYCRSSPRLISISQLNTLLCLHP